MPQFSIFYIQLNILLKHNLFLKRQKHSLYYDVVWLEKYKLMPKKISSIVTNCL